MSTAINYCIKQFKLTYQIFKCTGAHEAVKRQICHNRAEAGETEKLFMSTKNTNTKLTKSQLIKQQQRQRRISKITGIIAVVILAAVVIGGIILLAAGINPSLESTISVKSEYYDLNNATVAYLLYGSYNNYVNENSSLISYFGLDVSKSLKSQYITADMTWFDYFLSSTKTQLSELIALASVAKDNGYTLTAEEQSEIDDTIAGVSEIANTYGYPSVDSYFSAIFVNGVTEKAVRTALELQLIAERYANDIYDTYSFESKDFADYLAEHPESFYTADYIAYTVKAEYEKGADEATIEAAMKAAKEKAEGFKAYTTVEDFEKAVYDILYAEYMTENEGKETTSTDSDKEKDKKTPEEIVQGKVDALASNMAYSTSSETGKWMFDAARKAGDVEIFEDKANNCYTVCCITETSHKDEYQSLNVYHILVTETTEGSDEKAKAKAEEILKGWREGAADLESFKALATEKSEDTVSAVDGGLVGQITKGATVEEFDAWCFDEARKVGDVEIVKTDYGYHIIYFGGEDELAAWEVTADGLLKSEKYQEDVKGFVEQYPVKYDDKKLNYIPGSK